MCVMLVIITNYVLSTRKKFKNAQGQKFPKMTCTNSHNIHMQNLVQKRKDFLENNNNDTY